MLSLKIENDILRSKLSKRVPSGVGGGSTLRRGAAEF
jgi:hypothetical protein